MRQVLICLTMLVSTLVVGCGAANPPGWPSGEPRPINAQQQQSKVVR